MRAPQDKLTHERVKMITNFRRLRALAAVKLGQQIDFDEHRQKRQTELKCLLCYYSPPGIAGQAFTGRLCGICDRDMQFATTDTDMICGECATIHKLCRHCSANRELRTNRNDYTFAPVTPPEAIPPQAATVFLLPARKHQI